MSEEQAAMQRIAERRLLTMRCRLRGHDWTVIDYPAPMYPGVAEWAGTKRCRRCRAFRYWTGAETAEYRDASGAAW